VQGVLIAHSAWFASEEDLRAERQRRSARRSSIKDAWGLFLTDHCHYARLAHNGK